MAPGLKDFIALLTVIASLFVLKDADAGSKYNSKTGAKDFCVTIRDEAGTVVNDKCLDLRVSDGSLTKPGNYYLLSNSVVVGSATSMTSSGLAVPISSTLVQKAISSDPAFSVGTLANGRAGQLLTIKITEISGAGTFTVTPTTKTGFTSIYFSSVGNQVTLLYVDDTTGWIIVSSALSGVPLSSQWTTNASDIFYNTGNIGIGTSVPLGKLIVKGLGTTTGINFRTVNSSNTGLFTILDNGNVGIGSTLPAAKLNLRSVASSTLVFRLDTDAAAQASDVWFIEIDKNDDKMRFYNTSLSGTPSLVVTPEQGINTYSTTLDSITASTSDTTGGIAISNTATTGDATLTFNVTGSVGWAMGIDDSDSDKFKISKSSALETSTALTIDSNGNVGIGTSTGTLFVIPGLKSATGSRTLCIDSVGNVTSVAGACPGGT